MIQLSKTLSFFRLSLLLALAGASCLFAEKDTRLWYQQPAAVWTEALPVGNGRLGAMVYGRPDVELLQFNEDTLWTGNVHDYSHEGAAAYLAEIRDLLWAGKQDEAEELANAHFMSEPLRQLSYTAFGALELDFADAGDVTDYERSLDLTDAIARTRFVRGGVQMRQETFSSYPDQVVVHHVSANQPGAVSFELRFTTGHARFQVESVASNQLLLTGQVNGNERLASMGYDPETMTFAARVEVRTRGGAVSSQNGVITVEGADAATILLAADTPHRAYNDLGGDPLVDTRDALEGVADKDFATLRSRHLADYQPIFDRVTIDLGSSPYEEWPTDHRLQRDDKSDDPALAELFYQYGRYLLISSSRPGSQPANLQGIWNDQLAPSWGSKYTLNINAEMNYWPAEVANLSEMHEPFFDMIRDLSETGERVAQVHYDARGWVTHHNTDIWRGAAPINNANHGIWPMGGAWLVHHLWERFRYTQDHDFLKETAYPLMRDSALFFIDTLVEDPKTGWIISGPSNSPEHGGLVMGPAMDHQILRSLFKAVIETETILGIEDGLSDVLQGLHDRLAPNQIGRYGQLQEWLEDKDDPDNNHRHVSHLWGVFPGEDITWAEPALMEAARQSLLYRGDGGTGWALGWKIALWARFLDGDHAHKILMNQFNLVQDFPDGSVRHQGGGGVYPNLFDAHPPFQIDGNFAAVAGISEMLMQSHLEVGYGRAGSTQKFEIVLLPALPNAFAAEGSVTGLRARGGIELDFSWKNGALGELTVRAPKGGEARLRYGERVVDVSLKAGESTRFGPGLRDQLAYTIEETPLEMAERLMKSQVSRFREWIPAGRDVPARWDYSLAIVALGAVDLARATGDEEWLGYAAGIVADCLQADGSIRGYRKDEYNIDMVKPGSPALALLEATGDERYQQIAEMLRDQMRTHPRTSGGGFWHKEKYPSQMWLDGLYMASPFLARYAREMDEPAIFDDVVQQLVLMDEVAYDAEDQLFYHAWDEARAQPWADPETGLSANYWSRSIGWYGMALVDVMEFLPRDHPGFPILQEILVRWALGVQRWQEAETSLWWQVTDAGDRPGNYLEGTASSMFLYVLAKALNHDWLPKNVFAPTLEAAWQGLHDHLLDLDAEGRLNLMQCCRVAGLSDTRDGSFAYYLSEPIIANDLKGVGPLIRAGVELEEYFNSKE
jgi:alpha-L-fucosidase 2